MGPSFAAKPVSTRNAHPGPADVAIVIEIAEAALAQDRKDKGRLYARAGVPIYWIINLQDCWIEVYSEPQVTGVPAFSKRTDYLPEADVPLLLDGVQIATIRVAELLP
jgi:Uma2 family endonuclease